MLVISTVISGILVAGTPFENRLKALDEQKIETMNRLKTIIENYYSLEKRLPISLEKAYTPLSSIQTVESDITLEVTGDTEYQLCTTFQTDNSKEQVAYPLPVESGFIDTSHKSGYDCLKYKIPKYIIENENEPKTYNTN